MTPTLPTYNRPEPAEVPCGHFNENHHQCAGREDCLCDGKCNLCDCTGCPAPEYGDRLAKLDPATMHALAFR